MEREAPDVIEALLDRGGRRHNFLHQHPVAVRGADRPGDVRYETVTARRPVIEAALGSVVAIEPTVHLERGVTVTGLVADAGGAVPRVVGVRAGDGRVWTADLVVDAGGRRSPVTDWIRALGARPPIDDRADSGFRYFSRHYRRADGLLPEAQGYGALQHMESVSLLALPADNGTYAVGIITSARDDALRDLRHVGTWEAAVDCYPTMAGWLDAEPLTGVQVMASIEDRCRSFMVDDVPVVTGLVPVGDAWACTNPSLGRGLSIGAEHARCLRDVIETQGATDPDALVHALPRPRRQRSCHSSTRRSPSPAIAWLRSTPRSQESPTDLRIPHGRSAPRWSQVPVTTLSSSAPTRRSGPSVRCRATCLQPPACSMTCSSTRGGRADAAGSPTRAELLDSIAPALMREGTGARV